MKRRFGWQGAGTPKSEVTDRWWVSGEGSERCEGSGACIDVGCVQVDTGVG